MFITKEILNAMRQCRELTLVKRNDGNTYVICNDIEIASINAKVDKEYVIEAKNPYSKFYETFYVGQQENIRTMLSFLKVNDDISIAIKDCPMDDDLKLIEIHLLIKRPSKSRYDKYYDFLLSVTTERYL